MKSTNQTSRLIFCCLLLLLTILSATTAMAQHPPYKARVRLYVVEPLSRWLDYYYQPYHMGFLGFAYDTVVNLNYEDSLKRTITWNGATAGYSNVQENNIMVIAAIFADDSTLTYSDPGENTRPFYAHYVDAAAAATTTEQWNNSTTGGYTHTVFAEIGTGTWCPYCPATNAAMHAIYESGDYNFLYAEMIEDSNTVAHNRVHHEYNEKYYPTSFIDGAYQMVVGGEPAITDYTPLIDVSGARDVHNFDLGVTATWQGSATIQIQLNLKNTEHVNNGPATPSAPTVKAIGGVNENITVMASATDPDADPLYYRFIWKAGDTSTWQGPYNSGELCTIKHKWTDSTIAQLKVQTKDSYETASAWSNQAQLIVRSYYSGDANHSGAINLSDVSYTINCLYRGGPRPVPEAAGDINATYSLNLMDVSYTINFLYRGGPEPKYQF